MVAYHNTAKIFGFQYISLDEMDERLFGEAGLGDRVFQKCVQLLEKVAEEVVALFPGQVCQLFLCRWSDIFTLRFFCSQ